MNSLVYIHLSNIGLLPLDSFLEVAKRWVRGYEHMKCSQLKCLLVKHLYGSFCPEWLIPHVGAPAALSWTVQLEYCISEPSTRFQCLASKLDPQEWASVIFVSPTWRHDKNWVLPSTFKALPKSSDTSGLLKNQLKLVSLLNRTCCKAKQNSETHL